MTRLIDLMHLGRDRVIGAYERAGVVVDPGPSSCLDALLAGLEAEPRTLLLTHVHLDHAGAAGSLVRRFPGLRVHVHEIGAPHLADPSRLLRSAERLYGDQMERLWGEVAAVPQESLAPLRGGEEVEGFEVAHVPGHASHHVAYLDRSSGEAYVGDVAGVRIPPWQHTIVPTPPPDIDLEAWDRSLEAIARWRPERLCLTHFGRVDDAAGQLERARAALRRSAELARVEGREAFLDATAARTDAAVDRETALRLRQAAPPQQLWLGLERYWRTRAETAT